MFSRGWRLPGTPCMAVAIALWRWRGDVPGLMGHSRHLACCTAEAAGAPRLSSVPLPDSDLLAPEDVKP